MLRRKLLFFLATLKSFVIRVFTGAVPLTITNALAGNVNAYEISGDSKQSRLPSGYTELEYIKSSGTQYIDTGIIGRYNTSANIKFSSNGLSDNDILGCWDGTNRIYLVADVNDSLRIGYGTAQPVNKSITANTIYEYTATVANGLQTFTVDGTQTYTGSTSGNINNNISMYLFLRNEQGTPRIKGAGFTIYFCKIYQDNVLVRNFIPAQRTSDSVIGMYDLVSKTFFTNAGSGSFTAGPEVKPTPTNPIEVKGVGRGILPVGYTQLEYIQSQATITQDIAYIDTLFIPTKNSKARVKFCPVTTNSSGFFGARKDSESARFSATTFSQGSTFAFAMTKSTWSSNKTTVTVGAIYDCIAYNGKQIINGTEYTEPTVSNFSTTSTFKLAPVDGTGNATGAGSANIKFYLCQLWENDILVHDFIPAKNSSNILGMYDLVSNTFFTNAGAGSFTAGPEVTDWCLPITVGSTTYNPAIASPLHKVGNYADVLNSNGTITRNVGVKVFDGTENFNSVGMLGECWTYSSKLDSDTTFTDRTVLCTHFKNSSTLPSSGNRQGYALLAKVAGKYVGFGATVAYPTLAEWQAYLATQYANGTPVTIYYPLATPTTEQITAPTIEMSAGTNIIDTNTEVKASNVSMTVRCSQ